MKFNRIIELSDEGINLASKLNAGQLDDIGKAVAKGYRDDLDSRREWENRNADALKLAMQYYERKSWPWEGASNVRYPLITTTAMQYNARAYPALVPGREVVKIKTFDGKKDEELTLMERALNWAIMEESSEWEEETDKLLMIQPLIGFVVKKIFFDPQQQRIRSQVVLPQNFVVDYYAKSLESAARKTHVLSYTPNELEEMFRLDWFRRVEMGPVDREVRDFHSAVDEIHGFQRPPASEECVVLEQHCWLDLDEDGYAEPYVVHVLEKNDEVLRIFPRFQKVFYARQGDVIEGTNTDLIQMGYKIARIQPEEYFVKYGFIPSPDGSIYDIGLGVLLAPGNEAVNSLLNQLIDAGTLSNVQGGLLSRGIRIRSGDIDIQPGRWHRTDADAEELAKGIYPWPIKEPSGTLFSLLGLLIDAGQQVGSVSEAMMGAMPGQNTAATTVMASLEQGMQVFSAIYKRTFRSMSKEFRQWFDLTIRFVDPSMANKLQGQVVPVADPNIVSSTQRMMKAQALVERATVAPNLYGNEGLIEAERRFLEALQVENIEALLHPGEFDQQQAQAIQEQTQVVMQTEQDKSQREWTRTLANAKKDEATIASKQIDDAVKVREAQIAEFKVKSDFEIDKAKLALDAVKGGNGQG